MEVVLNINDLSYQQLFNNISLSVEKGKITALSGSNNSGKTTLVRILDRKIVDNFNINFLGKDIKDYTLEEYNKKCKCIYPNRYTPKESTVEEELDREIQDADKKDMIEKKLRLLKLLEKQTSKLTSSEIVWLETLLVLGKTEELVVIDGVDQVLSKQELEEYYKYLKRWMKQYDIAVFLTTTSLENANLIDFLYIIKDGEVILKGEPLTILQKDNIVNKAGLNVPFMIDLSVKLRDYDLIDNIELEKEK